MLVLLVVVICSCLMTRQQLIPATLSLLYGSYYPRVQMWRKSSGKRCVHLLELYVVAKKKNYCIKFLLIPNKTVLSKVPQKGRV